METVVQSRDLELPAFLARPSTPSAGALASRRGLVLCTGLPAGDRSQLEPDLAQRLATEAGWWVLTFDYRSVGEAPGTFSFSGWVADVHAAIDHLLSHTPVNGVWLAGFEIGGSLAVCAAAEDERVRGIATFGAPADFDDWAAKPDVLIERARRLGLVGEGETVDRSALARDLRELRPLGLAAKIPPRPFLVVHGTDDPHVPIVDARAVAEAAGGEVELRILPAAAGGLRHDPRAVAVLLGWMDRQAL